MNQLMREKTFEEKELEVVSFMLDDFLELIETSVVMLKENKIKIGILLALICIDTNSRWWEKYMLREEDGNKKDFIDG